MTYQRRKNFEELMAERQKLKDYQVKDPGVRYLTVNLNRLSLDFESNMSTSEQETTRNL
jgi:hypothetical protein